DEIENDDLTESISIPIVTLEPQPLLIWSQVIAGFGNITTAGFKFSLPQLRSQPKINPKPSQLTAETIVNRFRATASPKARRLAGLMAAAPVSLPVVQLIQNTLLPDSRQIHIAEVFMSGLLKSTTIKDNQANYIEYEFLPGVRKLLIDSVPKSKAISVIDAVSEYIAQKLGLSVQQFEARLLLPAYEQDNLAIKIRPFAKIKAEVFRRLGGIYAHIAEDLENNSLQTLQDFPPLQTLEYEVATISIKHDHKHTINLKNFIFEVATIQIKKSKYTTEIIINRQQHQNHYFPETLNNLENKIELEMVQIPDGTFVMGAPRGENYTMYGEFPQHQVTVPTFFMSQYPITQAQWKAVANLPQVSKQLKLEPSYFKGDNLPVEQISWYDAVEFCARLSNHTQKEYRLPSEAEWEYACRAGSTTPFHFGETITSDLANYNALEIYATEKQGKNRRHTTDVGHFAVANAFGLYDMHGNVWEWCIDDWHNDYNDAPIDSTAWLHRFENDEKYSRKILRGGSWFDVPEECRSACRSTYFPGYEYYFFGFRVVCSI
ncbi:MAG: formylglycine-generating enzyme family protein, partial [Cyanobacteria bacterium J06632_19]